MLMKGIAIHHSGLIPVLKEIIERSSNVGTIKITQNSNVSEIENFLMKFGFGKKTGVELTGETRGGFIDYKRCVTCLSSLSIGYSVNVSQYQMVRAYSIIANGGNDVKLTLTQKDSVDVEDIEIISAEMSSRLKKLLINVLSLLIKLKLLFLTLINEILDFFAKK